MEMYNTASSRFQSRCRHRGPGEGVPLRRCVPGAGYGSCVSSFPSPNRASIFPAKESKGFHRRPQPGLVLQNVPNGTCIEPGRPGPPSPHSVTRQNPEHVVAIFVQATQLRDRGRRPIHDSQQSVPTIAQSFPGDDIHRISCRIDPDRPAVNPQESKLIIKPARSGYRVSLPFFQLTKPFIVPGSSQSVPSRVLSTEMHDKNYPGSCSPFNGGCQCLTRTPSNRNNPKPVPSQM